MLNTFTNTITIVKYYFYKTLNIIVDIFLEHFLWRFLILHVLVEPDNTNNYIGTCKR